MPAAAPPPVATYRIQLRQGVDFDAVANLAGYLSALGVSHVYLSPCLRAAPDSPHGYDVTDPTRADEALGGEAGRQRMVAALSRAGLKLMLDIVPNHMSVASEENRWWWDVLENGPFSLFAQAFDVDWDGPNEQARSKVLLPVLSDHYGRVLDDGKIRPIRDGGDFFLTVNERRLPLSPASVAPLLLETADALRSAELELLAHSLEWLASEPELERRNRAQVVLKRQVRELIANHAELAASLDQRLSELGADTEALDALVAQQFYRLAHYRIARYDLDYRRFFDVNDLAALSSQLPRVFEATHALVLRWVDNGEVDALRVDHPDGLRDPYTYFQRLRQGREALWIVAEKILEPGEGLPADWPVAGTTGYDFLNAAGGLFVDPSAEQPFSDFYREFLGESGPGLDYAEQVRGAKRSVLEDMLASDLMRLTRLFQRICASTRRHRDFANEELRRALREVIAGLPVYRTYVQPATPTREPDASFVRAAIAAARPFIEDVDSELLGLLEELLCGGARSELEWSFVQPFNKCPLRPWPRAWRTRPFTAMRACSH